MTDNAITDNKTPPQAAPLVCVVGPTAVGKTALAVALARGFGGEVVSADSRQVYRGMRIGAAQPTEAERAAALLSVILPYHLSFCPATCHSERSRRISSQAVDPSLRSG